MKYLLAILLFIAPTIGVARGAEFDASLIPLCQQLAETPTDEFLRERFTEHESVALIKQGVGNRFHVSFGQISEQKERINQYARALPVLQRSLPQFEAQATAFLGDGILPTDFKIRLVCGMHSDGFGFPVDGKLQLFINLSVIKPDFLPSLLRHELWHVAFRSKYPKFADNHGASADPLRKLGYVLLNEGVGHYYSFQRRVEPTVGYDNWFERTDKIFSLLQDNITALDALDNQSDQKKLLFSSHAGVPFWKKWGALPGAIITYRLKKTLGASELRKIISGGPCEFLTRYQSEAIKQPKWEKIPIELQTATCS